MSLNLTKERMEERADESFHKFISNGHIKILMGLIPGPRSESLTALLRAAFDAGHAAGSGTVILTILEELAEKKKGPP